MFCRVSPQCLVLCPNSPSTAPRGPSIPQGPLCVQRAEGTGQALPHGQRMSCARVKRKDTGTLTASGPQSVKRVSSMCAT